MYTTGYEALWQGWPGAASFSGVFAVFGPQGPLLQKCCGLRNRGEALANNRGTAFGIASGTKLFTALAVCKLVAAGKLALQDKLWHLLPHHLGRIYKKR